MYRIPTPRPRRRRQPCSRTTLRVVSHRSCTTLRLISSSITLRWLLPRLILNKPSAELSQLRTIRGMNQAHFEPLLPQQLSLITSSDPAHSCRLTHRGSACSAHVQSIVFSLFLHTSRFAFNFKMDSAAHVLDRARKLAIVAKQRSGTRTTKQAIATGDQA